MTKSQFKQRVTDIVQGAHGRVITHDDDDFTDVEGLSNAIPVLRDEFTPEDDDGNRHNQHCWAPHNLHHFDCINSIVEFLWSQGLGR